MRYFNYFFRSLDRGDLILQVFLANTGEDIYLEGVKPCATVGELYELIRARTGIHPSRQRLFIGGEEMSVGSNLLDYFPTSHAAQAQVVCPLVLRCHVPLLISSLTSPGPMLAEVEVRPRNDEPVLLVKRRIRDKFRVEMNNQRLHVHPAEMTSLFLRQPLDDARLLSAYLSPNAAGNFLELVVVDGKEETSFNESNKQIYVRIPQTVMNSSKFTDTENLRFSKVLRGKISEGTPEHQGPPVSLKTEKLPPPPPPQTPESEINRTNQASPGDLDVVPAVDPVMELWWVTLVLQIDGIIKRDPKVEDIAKILAQKLRETPSLLVGLSNLRLALSDDADMTSDDVSGDKLTLKYCDVKMSKGGKELSKDKHVYNDFLMKREEMLLFISLQKIEENLNMLPDYFFKFNRNIESFRRSVSTIKPLHPLQGYDDVQVLYTSPSDPLTMRWNIEPISVLDCGASPRVVLELTGLSYSRNYGSWDIPEHRKTYVELILEGSFQVGDLGYNALLDRESFDGLENLDHNLQMLATKNCGNMKDREEYSRNIVYYVQDSMEVMIYGPLSVKSLLKPSPFSQSKPFGTSTDQFIKGRKKLFEIGQEIRQGEFRNPPMPRPAPFYMRANERNALKTTTASSELIPSWEDRRQLSKNVIGQWCLSRECVSDVTVGNNESNARIFSTKVVRGVEKDGRAFCKITYKRRIPVQSDTATIFPRSYLVDSFRNTLDFRIQTQFHISQLIDDKVDLPDTTDFKFEFRHWVSRVEHHAHSPDHCIQFESPSSELETNFKVSLANQRWRKLTGQDPGPTMELQKVSS